MVGYHIRKKKTSSFIALLLATVMVVSCVDFSAFADIIKQLASQTPKTSIIYVEGLDDAVTSQNLVVGSEESDIVLPETLTVKVEESVTASSTGVSAVDSTSDSALINTTSETTTSGTSGSTSTGSSTTGASVTDSSSTGSVTGNVSSGTTSGSSSGDTTNSTSDITSNSVADNTSNSASDNTAAGTSGNTSTGSSTTGNTISGTTTTSITTKQVAVTWSLDVEKSTTITYSSAKAGNVYVYEPELSGDDADTYEFADSVKLPAITVNIVKSEAMVRIEELIATLPAASAIDSMKDEELKSLYEKIDEIETLAEDNDIDLEEYEKYVEVYIAITELSDGADTPMLMDNTQDSSLITLGTAYEEGSGVYLFMDATGDDSKSTYTNFTVILGSTNVSMTLPSVDGYTASGTSSSYTANIKISGSKSAKDIAQDYISKIKFKLTDTEQEIKIILSETTNTSSTSDIITLYNATTGHYYQYVSYSASDDRTWKTAYTKAKSMTFMGYHGYLATVTSKAEDVFLNTASNGKLGWLGGTTLTSSSNALSLYTTTGAVFSTSSNNTYWYWACGPEAEWRIYDSNKCNNTNTDDTKYSDVYNKKNDKYYFNWYRSSGTNEPNSGLSGGEPCLVTLNLSAGTGKATGTAYSWNDIKQENYETSNSYAAQGYFVEFGNNLTLDVKKAADGSVDDSYDAMGEPDETTTDSGESAVSLTLPKTESAVTISTAKANKNNEISSDATNKKAAIDALTGLTQAQRDAAKADISEAESKATTAISSATSVSAISDAKKEYDKAVNEIIEQYTKMAALPSWATEAGLTDSVAEMVNGTIRLKGDSDTITTTKTIQIPEGSNVTIDLNGKTLKSSSGSVIAVTTGSGSNTKINITDNSTGGTKGKIVGNSGSAAIDMSGVSSGKTGSVTVTNGAAVQGAEGSSEEGPSTDSGTAIALGERSSATISDGGQVLGGSSTTGNGGAAITGGSGSSVTVTGENTVVKGGDGSSSTGKTGGTAITTSGTVTVEGGSVTGGDGATGANAITSTKTNTGGDTTATVTVTGGNITGGNSTGTDASGNGIAGGNGIDAAGNVSATGGTVKGGNGSNSSTSEGSTTKGGAGGVGIKSTSGTVTLESSATVTGGSGGTGATKGASGDSVTDTSGIVKGTPGWFKDLQKELEADGLTNATVTIDESGNVTITLTGDNTLTDSLTLPAGVNVTIDTAGHTLKGVTADGNADGTAKTDESGNPLPVISISSSASGSKTDAIGAAIKIKGTGSIIGADGASGSGSTAGGNGAAAIDASGATTGTTITIESATVKGGNGGTGSSDGSSDAGKGGNGGNAITGNNGVNVTITSGTVSGGNGGNGSGTNGVGGNGGAAITGTTNTALTGAGSDCGVAGTVTGGTGGSGAASGGTGGAAGVEGGTSGTGGVGTTGYETAKSQLKDEYDRKLAELNSKFAGTNNCTDADIKAAKDALKKAYDDAAKAIEDAKTSGNDAVQEAKTNGDAAIALVMQQTNALISMRDTLASLNSKSTSASTEIDGLSGLYTDDEATAASGAGSTVDDGQKKSTYTSAITDAVRTATTAITKKTEQIFAMTADDLTTYTSSLDTTSGTSAIGAANKTIDTQLANARSASESYVNTKTDAINDKVTAALSTLASLRDTGITETEGSGDDAISITAKLTETEYNDLVARINTAKEMINGNINRATSVTDIDAAKTAGDAEIDKILNEAQLTVAKTAAKEAVAKKAEAAKTAIDALGGLTDEQKSEAKAAIDSKTSEAKANINSATIGAEADSAAAAGKTAIDGIVKDKTSAATAALTESQNTAKNAISDSATAATTAINNMSSLDDTEKKYYTDLIGSTLTAANATIADATDLTAIENAKSQCEAIVELLSTMADAHNELDDYGAKKTDYLQKLNGLNDAEKTTYKGQVETAVENAIDAIKTAGNEGKGSAAGVNSALESGKTAVDNIMKEARNIANVLKDKGVISNTTDASDNEAQATFTETSADELESKILTSDEDLLKLDNGAKIDVYLKVEKTEDVASDDSADAAHKAEVAAEKTQIESAFTSIKAASGTSDIVELYDIQLMMKIGTETAKVVKETNGELSVTIKVPTAAVNSNSSFERKYWILRAHTTENADGTTSVGVSSPIACDYDSASQTITFKTDAFSTYALYYVDTNISTTKASSGGGWWWVRRDDKTTAAQQNTTAATNADGSTVKDSQTVAGDTPDTGDTANWAVLAALLAISVTAFTAAAGRRRKTKDTE